MNSIQRTVFAAAVVFGGFLSWSCGHDESPTFSEPLTVENFGTRFGVSTSERFGFSSAPGGASAAGAPAQGPTADAFLYDLPEGWVERAPTSMRLINLGHEDDPRVELTLVLLAGDGGGIGANVNRWRGQLGLAPLPEGEAEGLPTGTLLGETAVRFDASGAYSGMGSTAESDFRMVGLLAIDVAGSAFLKFTGPAALIATELASFEAFAASLRVKDPDAAPGSVGVPPAVSATAGDAASGAPVVEAPEALLPNSKDGLSWTPPSGWRQAPDRQMRSVTYLLGPQGEAECYVAVLGGDGGGLKSNLDRWRQQMGAGPLSSAELAGLERVPSLGGAAVLIDVPGAYRGMSGERVEDALMLGAVLSQTNGGSAERTVFVKLVGPTGTVEAERGAFRAFVQSLEGAQ